MDEIKKFMYECPSCHTGIQFDMPELLSTSQIIELTNAINNLICPRCRISLGDDAAKAFETIKIYNKAVHDLVHLHANVTPTLSSVESDED